MAEKAVIKLTDKQKLDLADQLAAQLPFVRDRRRDLTEHWKRNHSAWRGTHNRSFFHSDVFNHFIPAARRVVERFIVRGAQMLMPSSEFFEVFPADELSDEDGKRAESVRAYMIYIFRKKIKTYALLKQLLRCFQLYGRAIVKTGVKVEREGSTRQVWPTIRAVDPFQFFVWPETNSDLDQVQMAFEDNLMPWSNYKAAMDAGIADKIKRSELVKPAWPEDITDRLSKSGMTNPDDNSEQQPSSPGMGDDSKRKEPPQQFVFISEVWMRRGTSWWFVWLAWNVKGKPRIVRVAKKPFSRSAYRMAVNREIPGEHYTTSMMDDVEPIQVLLNDQFNLTLEGQAINFSPPTVIDPDLVSRTSSLTFRPRAKWLVKPEGVKFLQPHDTTRNGYQGIQFSLGLMDQFSGSSPLAEGQPTRNLPRAGFAVSSLLNLSLADIRDAAQMIEDQILTPALADMYRITVELVPSSQVFKIPGAENFTPKRLTTADLIGDFEFTWIGSLQFQDYQVRSQRLVGLLDTLGRFAEPIQRDLEIQGKKIEWVNILRRLWREGIGERGSDTLVGDLDETERLQIMAREIAKAQALAEQGAARGGGGAGAGRTLDEETQEALNILAESDEGAAGFPEG